MKFLDAKAELKELAKGKYHSMNYELTECKSGKLEAKCFLYIDPNISSSGETWEDALNKMKVKLGITKEKVDLSEVPGEEEGKE